MTDKVVPGSITDNYTSRNRVTHPPPCPHMAGPRSPFPLCNLDKVVGFLMPRSKASSPVPVPRPLFRFLVPRSGSSSPVPVPRPPFRFLVPCLQIYHTLPFSNGLGLFVQVRQGNVFFILNCNIVLQSIKLCRFFFAKQGLPCSKQFNLGFKF